MWACIMLSYIIDLVQDCGISSALALEIPQSCTKSLIHVYISYIFSYIHDEITSDSHCPCILSTCTVHCCVQHVGPALFLWHASIAISQPPPETSSIDYVVTIAIHDSS